MSDTFVYTAYSGSQVVALVVDGAPVGPLGRLFVVPPDEVVEVPEIAADKLCEHLGYLGVVKVKTIKTKHSLDFDIETAAKESQTLLDHHDQIRFQTFVGSMIEDRVSRGKIVPPPSPGIMDIMNRRGWKMEDYGVRSMGSNEERKDESVAKVQAENDMLKKEMAEMKAMLETLMAQGAGRKNKLAQEA